MEDALFLDESGNLILITWDTNKIYFIKGFITTPFGVNKFVLGISED